MKAYPMAATDVQIRRMRKDELDELIEVQNQVFSDYIVPMKSSKDFFLDFLRSVGGDLGNVLVASDGSRLVGYANPVLDGKEAWIGGVGVIPEYRRSGIGRGLMEATEDMCRESGVERIVLEVIMGNDKAHEMYLDLGFDDVRIFVSAEGRPQHFSGFEQEPTRASLSQVIDLHSKTYGDSCWQRRKIHGLRNSVQNSECYSLDGAFVVVRKVENSGYVPYLGVLPEKRRMGLGTSLAKFALNRLWELGVYKIGVYNLNEETSVLRLLDKFDFAVTLKQVEMRKRL